VNRKAYFLTKRIDSNRFV